MVAVIHEREELLRRSDALRASGRRLALVPTMGALHEGHLALVDEARRHAGEVWVSIFVNPTQFAPHEDFDAYPRTRDDDLERCRERGVDVVFAPSARELYPEGAQTFVTVEELQRPLCGSSRPHFFRGVATVVAKLLIAARPHVAVFGEKDYQQLAVVRRMARDLGLPVEVIGHPIVREDSGLALSSRNAYLDARTRPQAPVLYRALEGARDAVRGGERRRDVLLEGVRKTLDEAPLAEIDYAELRDAETLEEAPAELRAPTLLALAVSFPREEGARVRLIDNTVLRPDGGDSQRDPR